MSKTQWNLTTLFADESALKLALKESENRASSFQTLFKGNLKNLNEEEFLEAMSVYEDLLEVLGQIMTYAFLLFAKDSNNGSFYAKYQNKTTKIYEPLLFFELEFNKLSKSKQANFIQYSGKYRFYLESLKEQKNHQLSFKEERIMLKKANSSSRAFSRLFDEHFSQMKFIFKRKKISLEEVLAHLHDPNRDIRKNAASSLTKSLKNSEHLLAYIFNMIKEDHKVDCELRGYKNPETFRHLDNKISQKSVDSLVVATEARFDLVSKYYHFKKEYLKLDKLYDYDRYAPLEESEESFSYEESCKIVLDSFNEFSPLFGSIAKKAMDEGWIDVYPKDRKRGGAFSHPATPSTHPYVLLNHTDKRRDLFTLAHELGHAIHQYLAKDMGYLSSDTPLTTAETASVFAEMLVFDSMINKVDKKDKTAMLASKIEDIFATLYRQINFTTFERRVHGHEGELSIEQFSKIWMEESSKMFDSSVTLTDDYKIWWSYIPHFIHSPFYCYAYSYGQLLVLALYGLYKDGKCKDFVELYIEFLRLGGSKSPKELVALFGFDIEDVKFWEIGLAQVERLVDSIRE